MKALDVIREYLKVVESNKDIEEIIVKAIIKITDDTITITSIETIEIK